MISSLDSTTLTNPTGTPTMSTGLAFPSLMRRSSSMSAVGALPMTKITGLSIFAPLSMLTVDLVQPLALASSTTSGSLTKQWTCPPNFDSARVLMRAWVMVVWATTWARSRGGSAATSSLLSPRLLMRRISSSVEGGSMNIFELEAASHNSVEDIRELVRQVDIPPQTGRYKVYIIDEVHMLSTAAFNAFLKTLEEPPAYAKFILATTEKHKIIPTILSRCQVFDFKRIQSEDIVAHLKGIAEKEGVHYEEESLHIIARKAEGGLRDALSMFDQLVSFTQGNLTRQLCNENLNLLDYEYYFRLVDYFRQGDISNALLLYQDVIGKGFEGQHFITGLSEHLRNLMVAIDPATHKLMEVSDAAKVRYGQQAAICGLPLLLRWLEISSDYEYRYKDAGNKRLFIEVALMKLATVVTNP